MSWTLVITMVYASYGVSTQVVPTRNYNECKAIKETFKKQADERSYLTVYADCVGVKEK